MDASAFNLLDQIRKKHGTGDFGKVAQKLLAIVFCRLGYSHIEERGVQGVDIDVGKDGAKYAVEVKTTGSDAVTIEEKDVSGLQRRAKDGYSPAFAILKISLLSDWVIASAENILPGKVRIGRFSTQRILPLADEVNKSFSCVVMDYGQQILEARRSQAQWVAHKYLKAAHEERTTSHEHTRIPVLEEHITASRIGLATTPKQFQPPDKPKAYIVEEIRQQYPKAYAKWTRDEDERLRAEHAQAKSVTELASSFHRNHGAIRSRLRKLGLLK